MHLNNEFEGVNTIFLLSTKKNFPIIIIGGIKINYKSLFFNRLWVIIFSTITSHNLHSDKETATDN